MKPQRLQVGKLYKVCKPGPSGSGASFLNTTTGLEHAKTYDWKFNDYLEDGCAVIYLGTRKSDGVNIKSVWYQFLGPDGRIHHVYQRFEDEMFEALLTAEAPTR